jgi:DNA invertase Pin-like site-specific DNA recombinase
MSNKTNTNHMSINIPDEHLESVRTFLDQLSINSSSSSSDEKKYQGSTEDLNICEVDSIIGHRHNSTGWDFQIKWKGNRGEPSTTEWVSDKNTNCEYTINKYLKTKGINTAYCFCRVSTKKQVGETHVSLDAQASELSTDSSNKTPTHRVKIFKISASAYKNIPKSLKEIGEAVSSGDALYIYRVDRLSRNIIKYLGWLEDLDERGVIIYSHAESILYGENKLEFIQGILDAQKEFTLLGDRVKMSIKRRRDRGDDHIGSLKYGKKFLRREDGSLSVVENLTETTITNSIFNSKETSDVIAKNLNSRKQYKRGKRWNARMVTRIVNYHS